MSESGEYPPSMREELESFRTAVDAQYGEGYELDEDERRQLRFVRNLEEPVYGELATEVVEGAIDTLVLAEQFHRSGRTDMRTEGEIRGLFNHHVVERGDFWRVHVLPKIILHPELGASRIQSVAVERVLNSVELSEKRPK